MATIHDIQQRGRHLVLEAGTGTGKTVCALAASYQSMQKDGKRLIYATRTNSQQSQVMREFAAVKAQQPDPGYLIPLMGRRQYCPLLRDDPKTRDGNGEELARMCRDAKKKARDAHHTGQPVKGACPYYERLLRDGTDPVESLLEAGCGDGAQLAQRIEKAGSCPYEALKALLPRARGVVLPYIFLLDDRLRDALWTWMGTDPGACHVIIDEAHNLPEAARQHHSPKLTVLTIQRALKEAEEFHDPAVDGNNLATTVLHALLRCIHALADEFVHNGEDGLLPPDGLQEALMGQLRLPSPAIRRIAAGLEDWGEMVREQRRSQGRLPRSYLGAVGSFLSFWLHALDGDFVPLVTGGDRPAVEAYLLDPASRLGWLLEMHSTTHMSGTLTPTQEHIDLCGLPRSTHSHVQPSPFNPNHLTTIGVEGLHRRWSEHQKNPIHAERQQQATLQLLDNLPGKTFIAFPSHAMLRDWLEEGFLHGIPRPRYVEESDATTPTLVHLVGRFKRDKNSRALLLGVLGGRLTEGIDFPGDALQNLIILGIPYPRPTARLQALIHHHDRRHGKGWRYAVHNPVGRIMRQAVGRLIRGPEDHGTAVILDERITRFHDHLPRLHMIEEVAAITRPTPIHADGFTSASLLSGSDASP